MIDEKNRKWSIVKSSYSTKLESLWLEAYPSFRPAGSEWHGMPAELLHSLPFLFDYEPVWAARRPRRLLHSPRSSASWDWHSQRWKPQKKTPHRSITSPYWDSEWSQMIWEKNIPQSFLEEQTFLKSFFLRNKHSSIIFFSRKNIPQSFFLRKKHSSNHFFWGKNIPQSIFFEKKNPSNIRETR